MLRVLHVFIKSKSGRGYFYLFIDFYMRLHRMAPLTPQALKVKYTIQVMFLRV